MSVSKLLVNVREAGLMLGLGKSSIYVLIAEGALQTVLIRGARRITIESINAVAKRGA